MAKSAIDVARDLYNQLSSGVGSFVQRGRVTKPIGGNTPNFQPYQQFYQQQISPRLQQVANQPILSNPTPFKMQMQSPTIGQIFNAFVKPKSTLGQAVRGNFSQVPQAFQQNIKDYNSLIKLDTPEKVGIVLGGMFGNPETQTFTKQQLQLVRNGFSKGVRNLVGQFAEMVEKNPQGINRKALGSLGDYIQSLGETVFGKDAANLTNKQLKNAFDAIMQEAGKQESKLPKFSVGLLTKNIREGIKPTLQEIEDVERTILEEARTELQTINQANPYQQVFTKMRNFLRFAGEKRSKETGELFREHIPRSVFGQSSDELASSMGMTENELMAKMIEGLDIRQVSQITKKSILTLSKKAKDLYEKLDPTSYKIMRDIFNKVEAVSAEVAPQTLQKIKIRNLKLEQKAAQADFAEYQKQLFRQEGATRTVTGAVNQAAEAVKSSTKSPLSNPENLRDISGFNAGFRDLYRNFKQVFGKNFETAKRIILDPFDSAKGRFINEQKKWLSSLDENIVKKFGINKGSKESAAIQNFGEGKVDQLGLIKQFEQKKANQIMEADKWFRNTYNQLLDEVNAVRARIYPNDPTKIIPKRQDYYRHFREMAQGFKGLLNIFETPAGISSKLAGVSYQTKPSSKFLSFAQKRLGLGTQEDAVGGFLDYLKSASYAKTIDPMIGKFRALAGELATNTAEGANAGKLNNFITYLNRFADDLAGKTNPADRILQEWIPGGRMTFRAINWLNSRVKANTILGNLSSTVAQIFNVPQGIASAGIQNSVKGLGQSLAGMFNPTNPMNKSTFLKERYFRDYDKFDRGMIADTKKFAVWMTQVLDEIGSKYIWNSHYVKAINEGITNPIKYADDATRSLVAGRGIGEVPLAQKSKIFQLIAPFQLEVANLWHVIGDFVGEKAFGKIATLFIANYVFNKGAEAIRGSGVTFDPIQAAIDALGELDEKNGKLKAGGRLAGEVLSNVPLGQTLAALYPEYGIKIGDTQFPTRKEFFGREDPTRFGSGILATKGLQDPLYKVIPPFGGQQIKKTIEGTQTIARGYSETQKGQVRFPIEQNIPNVIRSVGFGQSSTPETRAYFNEDRRPLGKKQSELFKQSEDRQGTYNQILSDRQTKAEENKAREEVRQLGQGGQGKVVNDKYLYYENGGIKSIDMSPTLKRPELTGYEDIDKVLMSKYSSQLTTEVNNLVKLMQLGVIPPPEAVNFIRAIKNEKEQIKIRTTKPKMYKPKKITPRRVSARKTVAPKPIKFNLKTKPIKFKTKKVKLAKYKPIKK